MTTLAQTIIEQDMQHFPSNARSFIMVVKQRLEGAPLDPRYHLDIPFTSRRRLAERFIFNEDAPSAVKRMIESAAVTRDVIYPNVILPAPVTWIEWPTLDPHFARVGALIDSTITRKDTGGGPSIALVCLPRSLKMGVPLFLGFLPPFPMASGSTFDLFTSWTIHNDDISQDDMDDECVYSVTEALHALFLLSIPRVCEVRNVEHPHKLQRARAKRGQLPLIEYKHVQLRVGVGAPRYRSATGGTAAGGEHEGRTRLHRVIAHFRTYTKGREQPKVTLVEEHWRGDAELGVILHEREVKR